MVSSDQYRGIMQVVDVTKLLPPVPVQPPKGSSFNSNTQQPLRCPRCDSANTKFCYYNNYSLSQPRHFCKACKRYWTRGGTLRNVPVGGGCRKNKRVKKPASVATVGSSPSSSPPLVNQIIASKIPSDNSHVRSSSSNFNPFLCTLSGTSNQHISHTDNMGISEYSPHVLTRQPILDSINELQTQDCMFPITSSSILHDYSLVGSSFPLTYASPRQPKTVSSSAWLPLYQGGTYADDDGLGLVKETKEKGIRLISPQIICGENNQLGYTTPNYPTQPWSLPVSDLFFTEPTNLFGSSATASLI